MLIECRPGVQSARLPRGVTLGGPQLQAPVDALRSSTLGVPEDAGPSLARSGNAIDQRFPKSTRSITQFH